MIYEYRRGSTILVALDAVRGDVSVVTAIAADLMPVAPGGNIAENAQRVAQFAVVARAATADRPAGWTLSISASICANLPLGKYRTDARITAAGGVQFSEPLDILITEPVTAS